MTKSDNLKWCAVGNDLVTHFQARKNLDKDVWVRIRENEFKEMSKKKWQFSFFDSSLVNGKETAKLYADTLEDAFDIVAINTDLTFDEIYKDINNYYEKRNSDFSA